MKTVLLVLAFLLAASAIIGLVCYAFVWAAVKLLEIASPWDDEDNDDRCGIEHHFTIDSVAHVAVCGLEAGHGTETHHDEAWGHFWVDDRGEAPWEQKTI